MREKQLRSLASDIRNEPNGLMNDSKGQELKRVKRIGSSDEMQAKALRRMLSEKQKMGYSDTPSLLNW